MPAYSNLGIKLIDTGAEPAVWGISTNANLELFDSAVVGFANITIDSAGNSSSPNTLNVADFEASNGRNRIVQFNSTSDLGSSAFVQITPSDFEGYYYIKNNLSNGRSILLFQGVYNSLRDYEIPNGKDVLVQCTGTGDVSSVSDVLNDLFTSSVNTQTLTTDTFTATTITANTITATTAFSGPGTDLVGTANQLSVNQSTSSGTSTNASSINITEDVSSTSAHYVTIVDGTSQNRVIKVANPLQFTPSTGRLSATWFGATGASGTASISGTLSTNGVGITNLSVTGDTPTFNGTGALVMPVGTAAERPATPTVGMMRYNSSTGNYEVYTSTGWQNIAVGAPPAGLGVGQTWTNLTGRVFDTAYQNTTSKPIMAVVTFTISGTGLISQFGCRVFPQVGATSSTFQVATVPTAATDPAGAGLAQKRAWIAVIPSTWWYKIVKPAGPDSLNPNLSVISTWFELR